MDTTQILLLSVLSGCGIRLVECITSTTTRKADKQTHALTVLKYTALCAAAFFVVYMFFPRATQQPSVTSMLSFADQNKPLTAAPALPELSELEFEICKSVTAKAPPPSVAP